MPRLSSIGFILCLVAACGCQGSAPKAGSSSGAPAGSAAGSQPTAGSAAAPAGSAAAPAGSAAAPAAEECSPGECGPAMRMPNRQCPDGSMAGPTDRCLRKPDGRCGWEIRECP
jgi:hypothetical protein